MNTEEWIKEKGYTNVYTIKKKFGKYLYGVEILVEDSPKSIRFHVAASSGKKRKELDVFEDKDNKSLGGIKALIWIKNSILYFPEYYKNNSRFYTSDVGNKIYILIDWADSRRRDIYQRLEKEGFYFMNFEGSKMLVKEYTIC